ncbi:2-isopropylmalate synthase [Paramaledivibacter caminithermalis]|jgi:2-isopropylmalate synthase|uniref:2-isopropylmalate synthase n=1 Tax=Paramaledivibacter caminithermalis (strain DSM 15212 / CIP 107654 / DViRD3) TaxID=1121301 RepID=A0A1M6KL63_PARC5|nr:2-isopropylmalate synthase [Paramaledivibacter caminithermalis]SHJ59610.1 2-isopropylmalate synthase [Paramaledivibacter caminithermalis DSM 15212]
MGKNIKIFDTTLRDGEQSPGCSMNLKEKIQMAKQLEYLKVDIIEAGFAIASEGDFTSVKEIAKTIKGCTIASLARALPKDIDYAWEAVKYADRPRIHTFIATSDIHMKYKLKMKPDEVVQRAVNMVRYAKKYCEDIEFSAEDATRSDPIFLANLFDKVIEAGATVINIPDTVGYTTPDEYFKFLTKIKENSSNIHRAEISVHCHNDLGLAVANTLAAARAGATQFECTINGIGERAGNAALEEIVMAINTRKDILSLECNIDTTQILRSSKLLSTITGVQVQPNKAIVGANAFAHESGIHQHGVLEEKSTYEIMTPESIGLTANKMVLGKHSGRHAFEERLKSLGYELSEEELSKAFKKFKDLADKKKSVFNRDIEAIVTGDFIEVPQAYELESFVINSGNIITSTATIALKKQGELIKEAMVGDGPVDAAFKSIEKIVGMEIILEDYALHSVTEGKDAQGEAIVKISHNGKMYRGRGLSTDVVEASIKAYLSAVNKMLYEEYQEDTKTKAS